MLAAAVLSAVSAPARQQSLQLQTPPMSYTAADLVPPSVALRASQQNTATPEAIPDPPAKTAEETAAEALAQERDAVIAQRDADIRAGDGSGRSDAVIRQAEQVAQRDADILAGDGSGTVGSTAQDAIDANVKIQADRAKAAAQAVRDLEDAAKRAAEAAQAALTHPGVPAPSPEADGAAPLPAFSSPNAPMTDDALPVPVPVLSAPGAQAQASPGAVLDWASGLPLPPNPGGLVDPANPAAPAAAVGANGEKIDWASGLPVPVPAKQDQNLDCLSIQAGIPDMWCATRCVANGDCPPEMCKCGEGARQQGDEARAVAAKDW